MARARRVKPWYASRILWLNLLSGTVAGAAAFLPALQHVFDVKTWFAISSLVAGINVALRFATTDPLIVRRVREDEPDAGPAHSGR